MHYSKPSCLFSDSARTRAKKSVLRGRCASGLRVSGLPRARRRCRWMREVLPTTGEKSTRKLTKGGKKKKKKKNMREGLTADGSVTVDAHDAELARLFDKSLFEFLVAALDPERDIHATPDRLVCRALVKAGRFVDRGVQEGGLLVGKG